MRLLKANEINVKPKTFFERNGKEVAMLLLYKDARCDMNILDEEYGILNWQCRYATINNNLFCTISVRSKDGTSGWVDKSNVGTESDMEAEKGEASDAFKRAGFLLGIGRELYTAPKIYVTLSNNDYYKNDKSGKINLSVNYVVSSIGYDEERRCITSLSIAKQSGNSAQVVFSWNEPKITPREVQKEIEQKPVERKPNENKFLLNVNDRYAPLTYTVKNAWDHILALSDNNVDTATKLWKSIGCEDHSMITEIRYKFLLGKLKKEEDASKA